MSPILCPNPECGRPVPVEPGERGPTLLCPHCRYEFPLPPEAAGRAEGEGPAPLLQESGTAAAHGVRREPPPPGASTEAFTVSSPEILRRGGGTPLEWPPSAGVTEEEVRAFVGPRADDYLRRWGPALDGREAGFNWPAFLLVGLWLPYRKMYLVTCVFYTILFAVSLFEGVFFAAAFGATEAPPVAGHLIGLLAALLCGAFANRWYLAHVKAGIVRVRELGLEGEAHLRALMERGGTSLAGAFGMFLLFVGLSVGSSFLFELSFGLTDDVGTRLTFNGGELYFKDPVSEAEARRLGEYLVRDGFFDGNRKTVQLTKSSGTYQFRMVVLKGYENDPGFLLIARTFRDQLSRNVFGGDPVEIHLCDEYLTTLRVVKSP